MTRLFFIILPMAATALAGTAVIIALSAGYDDLRGVIVSAAIGAATSLPASWIVARKLI